MKAEELEKYLDQEVEITFVNNDKVNGILGKGDDNLGHEWVGKGYHIIYTTPIKYIYAFCFKKSHVKKIRKIA